MDRYAVFIDINHLFQEGGRLSFDSSNRDEAALYCAGVMDCISAEIAKSCSLPLLRTYWYDAAAPDAPLTASQASIARMDNAKLRLVDDGLPSDSALGVVSAIRRDLLTLADAHAICDAYLLADDDHLAGAIDDAQDKGVRVSLFQIAASGSAEDPTAAVEREADRTILIDQSAIAKFLHRKPAHQPEDASDAYDPISDVTAAATKYTTKWLSSADDNEFERLVNQRPRIPEHLDRALLVSVETATGDSLRGQERLRRAARQAFWDRVEADYED